MSNDGFEIRKERFIGANLDVGQRALEKKMEIESTNK